MQGTVMAAWRLPTGPDRQQAAQVMTSKEKGNLLLELARLHEVGLPSIKAIEVLRGHAISRSWQEFLSTTSAGLQEGLPLPDAMAQGRGLDALDLALIRAGSQSGRLEQALRHLADHHQQQDRARAALRAALPYPLLLLHLGLLLPQLGPILAGSQNSAGLFFSLLGLWLTIGGVGLVWRWLSTRAELQARLDAALGRVPLLGPARRHGQLAVFCQTLALGVAGGLPWHGLLQLLAEGGVGGHLRQAATQAREGLAAGLPLAEALDHPALPPEMRLSLQTAEITGRLDESLAELAQQQRQAHERALQWAARGLAWAAYGISALTVLVQITRMARTWLDPLRSLMP